MKQPSTGSTPDGAGQDRLLFRRQFVLGPRYVEGLPSWKKILAAPDIHLTVHPDLDAEQSQDGDASVTLLGYVLDYRHPEDSNKDIVDRLLKRLREAGETGDVIRDTFELSGRWVLILTNGDQVRVLHDATGLRQVHYTNEKLPGETWCASQPALLAEVLGLESQEQRLDQLVSCYEKTDGQYWFPGDLTPYEEISQLLPNHWLDVRRGLVRRYWPDEPLTEISREASIDAAAAMLTGALRAASLRFPLALTVTAGLDSRVVLAACRDIRDEVRYFTAKFWDMTDEDADLTVPRLLLERQGLRHEIVECLEPMSQDFAALYQRNVRGARKVYGPICQGHYVAYPDAVCVKGNAAEIARRFYGPRTSAKDLTTGTLARLVGMVDREPATAAFDRWLSDVRSAANNYSLLDLFYWEQRMPCWQGMAQSESDMAQDTFTPFNCRALLTTLLAVNEAERSPPNYRLFRDLIAGLWPALLSTPINPHKRVVGRRIVRRLRRVIAYTKTKLTRSREPGAPGG